LQVLRGKMKSFNKILKGERIPHVWIDKTVEETLKSHKQCRRYPCGPHGPKTPPGNTRVNHKDSWVVYRFTGDGAGKEVTKGEKMRNVKIDRAADEKIE
jgi:hypothetical protein